MSGEEYVDDSTIGDEDVLLRRIPPVWWIPDENLGRLRPTSQAFNNHGNGSPMSVHLQKVLEEHRLPVNSVLEGHVGFALASITAGLARTHAQRIRRKPLDDDPAHAEVFGEKTRSVRKAFAMGAVWAVPPEG
jgi:hypothetical protein